MKTPNPDQPVRNTLKHLALALAMGAAMHFGASPASAAPPVTADLKLHLDASQLTGLRDGATVTTWTDMSGLGNSATATSTPIYMAGVLNGQSVVRFNGSSSFTTPNLSGQFPTAATGFIVTTINNDNAYTLVHANPGVDKWWRWDGNGRSYPGFFRGNRIEGYCAMPNSGSHLLAISSSAGAWVMAINGVIWLVSLRNQPFGADGTEQYYGNWSTTNATSLSNSSLLDAVDPTINTSTFVAGYNHVLFENVVADGSGNIVFTATVVADSLTLTDTASVEFTDPEAPVAFKLNIDADTPATGLVGVVGGPAETWNQGTTSASNLIDSTETVASSVSVTGLPSDGYNVNAALKVFASNRNFFGGGTDTTLSITGLVPNTEYDLCIYSPSHNVGSWGNFTDNERSAMDFITSNTVLGNGQSHWLDNGLPGVNGDMVTACGPNSTARCGCGSITAGSMTCCAPG